MFKDKRFTIPFIAELIMPWLILIPGVIANYYFFEESRTYNSGNPTPEYYRAKELFEQFYSLAMGGGVFIIFAECIIRLVGFIWMAANIFKKNKKSYCIMKPLVLWLCPHVFTFGTLLLMLLIHAFTYGMGI